MIITGDSMDYYLFIWSIVVFIENRLISGFKYKELEKATGYSLSHIRSLFAKLTGKSLSRYILSRRIAHAAFDIIHSDDSILNISVKYGFNNPDTFTRAFFRITGYTPQDFRKRRRTVGRVKLCSGVYGVSEMEVIMNMNNGKQSVEGSTILYGVPKVGYGEYGGCTPFPICLKAAANYLGEDIDYDYAMVVSGAAFRLTWDETCWNGGNVDVIFAFDDPEMVYKNGIEALGRKFELLTREPKATKEDFISFIKKQIDKGYPCIGLGFIGPPEACLITGYRNEGKTLLGWNFFQDCPEYAAVLKFDDSGYFITDSWWENKDTVAVMAMGEKTSSPMPLKTMVQNAITVLSGRRQGNYAKGLMAYDAWKKAITDESQFPVEPILPLLAERLMCQGDATDCISDGRSNVAKFFRKLAEQNPEQPLFREIAGKFHAVAQNSYEMYRTLGGWQRGENQMRQLSVRENRLKIAELIDKCKAADSEALQLLQKLEETL